MKFYSCVLDIFFINSKRRRHSRILKIREVNKKGSKYPPNAKLQMQKNRKGNGDDFSSKKRESKRCCARKKNRSKRHFFGVFFQNPGG